MCTCSSARLQWDHDYHGDSGNRWEMRPQDMNTCSRYHSAWPGHQPGFYSWLKCHRERSLNRLILKPMCEVWKTHIFALLLFIISLTVWILKLVIIPVFCPTCFKNVLLQMQISMVRVPMLPCHVALFSIKYTPSSTNSVFILCGCLHTYSYFTVWLTPSLRPT